MTLHRTHAAGTSIEEPAVPRPAVAPPRSAASGSAISAFSGDTAVLLVARMRPGAVLWGWSRLVRGARALRHERGLRFAKVLGSGHEGRFGVRPSASVQGLFALFEDDAGATRFAERSAEVQRWRDHAQELVLVRLRACSSRGSWSGHTIGVGSGIAPRSRVASLTRASIRPARALAFWRRAAPAQDSLDAAAGCVFAAGLGEAPLLRQATFTIWDSAKAMDAYARTGAHLDAIRAAQRESYFSESMFVRFEVLAIDGQWQGRNLGGDDGP